MKLSSFTIAVLFIVAASISIFAFMTDMYTEDGYDMNLSEDPNTAGLGDLQADLEEHQTSLSADSREVFNNSIGEPNAEIKSGEITEGDLIAASGRALTNIPSYLNTFMNLILSGFNILKLGDSVIFWFIFTAFILIIAFLLAGVFVKQVL